VSILNDLTLEICVPNFRCKAAQRMQRKIPICRRRCQFFCYFEKYIEQRHTFQLAHPIKPLLVCDLSCRDTGERTWGQGIAIGTSVIARNGPDQLRKGLFIPRLLALADT
jgi:hypothetical protein